MEGAFALTRWTETFSEYRIFLSGFLWTIIISFFAIVITVILGTLNALMATSRFKSLQAIARIYVEAFQNTPLLIIIFFLYFVVPKIPFVGFSMPPFLIGIIGVGIYHGAYMSEVVRAGILSISKGQFEAAYCTGFNYIQTMGLIILPQTTRAILPPFTNQIVNLIKNTSILTIIAAGELMYNADTYAQNGNFNYAPSYIIAGFLYFIVCLLLSFLLNKWENRLKIKWNS